VRERECDCVGRVVASVFVWEKCVHGYEYFAGVRVCVCVAFLCEKCVCVWTCVLCGRVYAKCFECDTIYKKWAK
jgi:hypothetical protein